MIQKSGADRPHRPTKPGATGVLMENIIAKLAALGIIVVEEDDGRAWLASGRAGFTAEGVQIVVLDGDGVPSTQDGSGRVSNIVTLARELSRLDGAGEGA